MGPPSLWTWLKSNALSGEASGAWTMPWQYRRLSRPSGLCGFYLWQEELATLTWIMFFFGAEPEEGAGQLCFQDFTEPLQIIQPRDCREAVTMREVDPMGCTPKDLTSDCWSLGP